MYLINTKYTPSLPDLNKKVCQYSFVTRNYTLKRKTDMFDFTSCIPLMTTANNK